MANHPWRQGAMTQAVPLLAAWVKTPNWIQTSYIPKLRTRNSWPLDLPIGTIGRSAQRGSTTSPESETPSKLYQPTTGICYISAKVYVELALGINWHQKGNNQMLTTTNAILYFTQMSPCFHQHKRRPMEASIKSFFPLLLFFGEVLRVVGWCWACNHGGCTTCVASVRAFAPALAKSCPSDRALHEQNWACVRRISLAIPSVPCALDWQLRSVHQLQGGGDWSSRVGPHGELGPDAHHHHWHIGELSATLPHPRRPE